VLSGALLLCAACGETGAQPQDAGAADAAAGLIELPLIDPGAFRYADRASDPLAAHQPREIRCGIAGFYTERGELEMDTGSCNYLYLEQPALRAVQPGGEVRLVLRHFDLAAPEPAEAHVAILFGDAVQWETTIAVPGMAQALEVSWRSDAGLQLTAPIRVHLHNHGQNTWTLASLTALVPEEP
jgi:hypothetical protein